MKKIILGVFFFLQFVLGYSQQQKDTIYYNKNWSNTTKEKAVFYRPMPLEQKDTLFVVKDYYKNGALQMEGFSSSDTDDVFEGKIVWYYPNGNTKSIQHFTNGDLDGGYQTFYENGTLKTDGISKSGGYFWEGTFPYSTYSNYKIQEVKEGCKVAIYSVHKDSYVMASKRKMSCYDKPLSEVFYNKKGEQISEVFYNIEGYKPYPEKGVAQIMTHTSDNFVDAIIGTETFYKEGDVLKVKTKLNALPDTYIGTYKDAGFVWKGTFYKDGSLITYVDGEENGTVLCCFDTGVKIVEGTYKNGIPYNGTFNDVKKNTITNYKNGYKEGVQIVYNDEGRILAQENYSGGSKSGTFISTNPYNNTAYTCEYSLGRPYEGKVYENNSLKTYNKGRTIESITYYNNTNRIYQHTKFNPEMGTIESIITYDEAGNPFVATYKNGSVFEGKVFTENNGYKTYANGKYNGPYLEKMDNICTEKGTYKDFNKEGIISFKLYQQEFECLYKEDKPIEGVAYLTATKEKVTFKNGKRNGNSSKMMIPAKAYDSLTLAYKDNLPVGKVQYFKQGHLVNQGTYKDAMPYDGIFYKDDGYKKYKKGRLLESFAIDENKSRETNIQYKNNLPAQKTVILARDTATIYHIKYKKGKPYSGDLFSFDKDKDLYSITPYKKGYKEGVALQYTFPENRMRSQIFFKKGKKESNTRYYFKGRILKGRYKNDKPFEGEIVTEVTGLLTVTEYLNGEAQKSYLYSTRAYDNSMNILATGIYKNGKPYSGIFVFKNDYYESISKEYVDGKHLKTYVLLFYGAETSKKYMVEHKDLVDEVALSSIYTVTIQYHTTKKVSGKATYKSMEGATLGTIAFKNNTIVSAEVSFPSSIGFDGSISFNSLKKELEMQLHFQEIQQKVQFASPKKEEMFMFLSDCFKYLSKVAYAKMQFYFQETKLAEIEIKDGKPYNGALIRRAYYGDTKKYNRTIYTNGKKGDTEIIDLDNL